MRASFFLLSLLLAACGSQPALDGGTDGGTDAATTLDSGGRDGGSPPRDGGPPIDGGVVPGFEHCPPASAYVGDPSWQGSLTTGGGALFCTYPRMFETAADAISRKQRLLFVAGTYPYPLAATDAPFRLPACLEQRGATVPPEILEGTVSAERRQDFDDVAERYHVESRFPLAGSTSYVRFDLAAEIDATAVDLSAPVRRFGLARAQLCQTDGCFDAADRILLSCNLVSNTCDELAFTGGSVTIDQFHWAGAVGSGFAAGVRVRGSLDGVDFDITDYDRMTVTYGHHAFSRGLSLTFDAPIGSACGLSIEEISESGATGVALIDCAGTPLETRALTGQTHLWQQPCP